MDQRIIQDLDDQTVLNLLQDFCEPHVPAQPALDAQLADVLRQLPSGTEGPVPSNAAAARLALELLAEDSRHADGLARLLASGPTRMAIEPATGVLLGAAILFALQTHVEFIRDKSGRWSLKLVKKPTRDGLISPLVKKLLALIRG